MSNLRNFKAIGTVAYGATVSTVYEKFSFSYAQMREYNATHLVKDRSEFIYYDRQQISWIPRARNDMVKSMRGDWIFMLDADLEFEPDVLERMLYIMDKYQAPVLTGLYVHKKKPGFPVAYFHNDRKKKYEIIAKWEGNPEIFQVDAAGAGALLVKKFVFNYIWEKLNEDPFDVIKKLGEDFSFFDRLRRCGVGVYCTPQVKFTHLGVSGHEYNPNYGQKMLTKPYTR